MLEVMERLVAFTIVSSSGRKGAAWHAKPYAYAADLFDEFVDFVTTSLIHHILAWVILLVIRISDVTM